MCYILISRVHATITYRLDVARCVFKPQNISGTPGRRNSLGRSTFFAVFQQVAFLQMSSRLNITTMLLTLRSIYTFLR
jgi:hypothetical protein